MSGATYKFAPWARAGLAAQIADPDTRGADIPGRARLQVDAVVARQAGAPIPISRGFVVNGPGDVIGIDHRQVIRTDPKPDDVDFEPNFLVQVEFDRPDFPWLFTPAAPNARDQLRPWLVLVVIAVSDAVTLQAEPDANLPVLTIPATQLPSRQLPDLADSWAWAHAQIITEDQESLEEVLGRPERTASRLICSRRLDARTRYHACLVPAFEAGRLAGLGITPASPDATATLQPAWTVTTDAPVKLPVYYSWSFTTGDGGDFESLAERLRPAPVPPGVGETDVYFADAGGPLSGLRPDQPGAMVRVRGALIPPNEPAGPWPAATRRFVENGFRNALNGPAQRVGGGGRAPKGPDVGPPMYGRWLAAQPTIPASGGARWLRTLNLDPRNRAIAGLGSRVVQATQEALIEQAWEQVGDIEKANRELRWAQLATAVRATLVRKHAAPRSGGGLLQLTQLARRRIFLDGTTVWAAARTSAIPEATMLAPFQRAIRPRGPLGRRAFAPADRVVRPIVDALDVGLLSAGLPARDPDGLADFAAARPERVDVDPSVLARIAAAAVASQSARPHHVSADDVRGVVATDAVVRSLAESLLSATPEARNAIRTATRATTTSTRVATTSSSATRSAVTLPTTLPPVLRGRMLARARALADSFRDVTMKTLDRVDNVFVEPAHPQPSPLGVADIRGQIIASIDPTGTILARVDARIDIPNEWRPVQPKHPLDEVLAVPTFSQPAWELVRDHFPEQLLPGIDKVPENSVSVMQTNAQFVEAFLVGMNHEFGRELLWREYPTDQRGTAFRRFWAPAGEDDIPEVHRWDRLAELGESVVRTGDSELVLLVRGELLRRYPSAVVYAAPDQNGKPDLSASSVKFPLFRGRIDPDITFVGFDLTADSARLGWWFVFEEQPTEPRFALDVARGFGTDAPMLNGWNDLTWGHLATDAAALKRLNHIPLTALAGAQPAAPKWAETASAMASILVQQPVRILIPAVQLLDHP